ncbi:pyrroline-5-carboxylate reductase [Halalkalibacterium ligniniphilum]|uniref:pyrroline-5-carboxylate reductase n=1 Tax=Halalkalibacterium ligniniphilum TaxID=1134413 RepID=UPI0003484E81|nr:pyrroline-5-carboxylate reductase [Halalkalibacterium ligniniphilum]
MEKISILFIGAGRMAEAIFAGIIRHQPETFDKIIISNQQDKERLEALKQTYGVITTHDWTSAVSHVDVILLACPPGAHHDVLKTLNPLLTDQFVVTVAAGIGPSILEASLPSHTPVAWVMPNTAAVIGESMTIYTYGSHVEEHHRRILETILATIGSFEELTEKQVHQLTAVTGSAPAFFYLFAEALEQAALSYELKPEQARKLVIQMLAGSAKMLTKYQNPALLRDQVTSPGGSTAAGLDSLRKDQLERAILNAVNASNARAQELAK